VPTTFGDAIFIASMLNWAFYSIFCGKWFGHMPFDRLVRASMALSALTMLPLFLFSGGVSQLATISSGGWVAVLYLGVLSSAVGYYIWNLGVEKLGPSRASAFLYVEPLTAVAGGTLLFGEKLSWVAASGGLLILMGVYWINGGRAGASQLKKIYAFLTFS
ncbi:MAG TPA: EamA family transporter, partial [Elusimicrobiales bacterium]|nr:EamA family transporter [Elusimicrobiales bacterium]